MSGRMSRNKGKRVEYLVRDQFRVLGYSSNRVPSSGAAQGFKGDVVFEKDGKILTAEVKARKDGFRLIYHIYDQFQNLYQDDRMTWVQDGVLVTLSGSLMAALESGGVYPVVTNIPFYAQHKRTFQKVMTLRKVVKTCDILVIKDNNKPLIYIRYQDL